MPQMTIPQAFELALRHHQAGQLQQAEHIYRQILAQQPKHADALHFLGLIAHQAGRHDMAVDLIRQSVAVNPEYSRSFSATSAWRSKPKDNWMRPSLRSVEPSP